MYSDSVYNNVTPELFVLSQLTGVPFNQTMNPDVMYLVSRHSAQSAPEYASSPLDIRDG